MKRLLPAALVLLALACEHGAEPRDEIQPRPKRESAAGLLQAELQLTSLQDFVEYTPGIPNKEARLAGIQFLRAHIGRCEGWLAETETDRRQLMAAHVGLDLVGVGYDLIRVDLEATLHHLGGLARKSGNVGLEAIWRSIRTLERDPSAATSRELTADLLDAKDRRNDLLITGPMANDLRPGVLAASNTSGAYGLAKAATVGGPALARLAGFLTNPEGAAVGVEVSASGAAVVSVVAGSGAVVLTEAEIIALAQTGAISVAAIQLAMMANG